MSRFYRALKEASRTLPQLADVVGEHPAVAPDREPDTAPVGEDAVVTIPEIIESAIEIDSPRTLGVLTEVALDQKARLIPHVPDRAVMERYRRLRTKIIQEQEKKAFKSLVVTSPNPQDGKTVTVLNLAWSCGLLPSYPVLVVDGDLRKGSLGKWLGVGEHPGLSNLIEGSAQLEDVVLKCDEIPVHFMVRGTATSRPGELLNSAGLSAHFQKMAEHFSLVLIDSPPVNLVTDAQLIAGACDAVLLIARAFATTHKAFERAVQDLSEFRVIGSVLNGGTRADLKRRYKDYY